MDENALADALARAERALDRIEHASASSQAREDTLRDKVRGVVAELDDMLAGRIAEPARG